MAFLTYFTYFALEIYAAPAYSDIKILTDLHAQSIQRARLIPLSKGTCYPVPVPQAYDLPIGFVNQVLYGKRRRPIHVPNGW